MSGEKKSKGKFRLVDFLVILLCLSGAAYSVNLFWEDLFQTLNGQNKTPIGTVSIKRNIVQRRMSDRVIWDRLIRETPVYSNDMIRVGDNSEIDLHVGGNDVTINQNTLLRLRYDKETDEFQIDLSSGSIGLVTDPEGGSVVLNIMGKQMKAGPGTALNAAAGENGVALQVSKGSAVITEDGHDRELGAGEAISMDSEGSIRSEPAVFVIQPKPNALYRKSADVPLNIAFSWNRINLQPDDTLRLEIAGDQSFSRSVRTLNELNDSAQTALSAGLWNWRLTYNGAILDSGHFTITDAEGIELLSPSKNNQFFYETEPPKLYFQWSQIEDVSYCILEVDVTPEFRNPIIKKQITSASFSDSSLTEGIWYWRVTPVFSQANEGDAVNPRPSTFRIVKGEEPQTPSFTSAEEPAQTPRQPQVTPVPLLPAPANRQPADGYRIGIEELEKVNVNFNWSAVNGANAYIFTLYQETNNGRWLITQIGPENRTSWSIDIKTLGRGIFLWRVEAVKAGRNNEIEQHGNPVENRFVVDIPRAGPIKIINGPEVTP
ncbi:hypothetical protein [Treponema sp. R80B11-R83G3]